jgi:methylglutaconyl-CoA hydratase
MRLSRYGCQEPQEARDVYSQIALWKEHFLKADEAVSLTVLVSETDGVRTITLNRPERRNALTPEMQTELTAALEAAAASPTTRVVVLTGAGSAFCGGLDLSVLQAMAGKSSAEMEADAHRLSVMFRTLYELPVPTIAAVNGHAVAGGTGLAMFTVSEAKFGFTECKIGFVPALVSAYLRLQVGDKLARDLLLTGRLFSAEEAKAMGLVNEVVAPDALAERIQALITTLLANSPSSLRATKALLTKQNGAWLHNALQYAMEANAQARQTEDFREGVAAFLEKRKPNWR